jgi:hypothetical protein
MGITHLDGADVVVIDLRGHYVPAIDEVRLEADRACVAVHFDNEAAQSWYATLRELPADAEFSCAIESRDGRVHYHGPVSLAYV